MTHDLWMLLSLVVLTELLTMPPLFARASVPGGIRWIFYNRDTVLEGVAPWGERAVRAHSNMADNLAIYAGVIVIAHLTGAANETTAIASTAILAARVLHAAVYIAGVPYLRTAVFAVAQFSMLVCVWQIAAHFLAQ
jgi:uncharacterized MAPEG superfamily protein